MTPALLKAVHDVLNAGVTRVSLAPDLRRALTQAVIDAEQVPALRVRGDAHRHRLVSARLSLRRDD